MARSNSKEKLETGVDLSQSDIQPETPSTETSATSKIGSALEKQTDADQEAFDADIKRAKELAEKPLDYHILNPNHGKHELGVKVPEDELKKRRRKAVQILQQENHNTIHDLGADRKKMQETFAKMLSHYFNEDGKPLFPDAQKVAEDIVYDRPVLV